MSYVTRRKSAAVSAVALVGVTVAWLGLDIWKAFLAVTPIARDALELGRVEHYKFQSTFAAVRLLGGSVGLAYGMQAAVTLAAVSIGGALSVPLTAVASISALCAITLHEAAFVRAGQAVPLS